MSKSLYSSNGSRLYRMVAWKRTGSCGIIEIFERKSLSAMLPVSTLSMTIDPSNGASLNKAAISEDFPAPVRPTIPT